MRDVLRIIADFADGSLTIRTDGPPNDAGEANRRVIVEGDPRAFRMLAETLLAMAEAVETDPAIRPLGWQLVLSPEDVPRLRMDAGHLLVLDCGPEDRNAG